MKDSCSLLDHRRKLTVDGRDLIEDLCAVELPLIEQAVLDGRSKRWVLGLVNDLKARLRNTQLLFHLEGGARADLAELAHYRSVFRVHPAPGSD